MAPRWGWTSVADLSFPASCDRGAPAPWAAVFNALRAEALASGWTSARLARELFGVSRQHLREWYIGRRDPPLWAVRRLAHMLGRAVVLMPDRVLLPDASRLRRLR